MGSIKIIWCLSLIIILSACSSFKKIVIPDITTMTYRDLLQHNLDWQKSIRQLSGNVRITLDTKQYSGNFNGDIFLNGSDSLFVSITGPLGIRVGKIFIAKSRFIFYSQVTNQFYTGRKADFAGMTFFQFPVEISEVPNVLLAQDKFDILINDQFTIRDQMYYLEAHNGSDKYRIWFDPEYKLIKKIEYFRDNKQLCTKEYDQFEPINGIYFPRQINYIGIIKDDERQGMSVYYNEISINTPILDKVFDINVSDNATQIDLSFENKP